MCIWKGERKTKSFIVSKRVCVQLSSYTCFPAVAYASKTWTWNLLLMMCGMRNLPDSKAPSCILSSNILTCTLAHNVVWPAASCPSIGIESKLPTIAINHRAGFWGPLLKRDERKCISNFNLMYVMLEDIKHFWDWKGKG